MFVVRAAKDWLLLIQQHRRASLPAFLAVSLLYLGMGTVWPKQYTGSALVELNPSINWQSDINNQHLTATAAIRNSTSRADWAAIVDRLHLYPQTVTDGRLADAADYLASQVSIKQIEDAAHGGLVVRIDYTDPHRNVALGVTQAIVENLTRPMPQAAASERQPLLPTPQIAPPSGENSTRRQRISHTRSAAAAARQSAAPAPELAQQLQVRLAEGSKLQEALVRNTLELNGLRDQLTQEEQQAERKTAEPEPERKPATPKVDPRVENLRADLARAEQALLELRQRYTDDYPDVVAAREHVQDLQLDISRLAPLDPPPALAGASPQPTASSAPPAPSARAKADAGRQETLRRVNEAQSAQDKLRQDIDRNRAAVARLQAEIAESKGADPAARPVPGRSDLAGTAQAGTDQPGDDLGQLSVKAHDATASGTATLGESNPLATSFTTSSAPLSLAQSPTVAARPQIFVGWIFWFLSVALGAVAAFVAAWLVELRDPSIRTEGMLRCELPASAEYLGGIPRVRHEAIP